MITAIFFDFDGVIVESCDIKTEAFRKLFLPEGNRVAEQVVAYHTANAGVSRFDKFRYIYREILKRPLSDEEFDRLCSRFAALVVESVVQAQAVRGAQEFLEAHGPAYSCFIVSATPQEEIVDIIRRRGMDRFFRKVVGAPTAKNDAVRDILAREHIAAQNAVYIGDAMSDYHAARANNVHFIARIYQGDPLFAAIDCLRIKDLSELHRVIESIA